MKCPRCKLPLREVAYEGVATDMCEACWGFWLDSGELKEVIQNRALVFSDDERKAVLALKTASKTGPTPPTPCLKCGKVMSRVHFDDAIHLVIDRCDEHGVWLDTGEIKRVQALADHSKAMGTLLIKKLGLS